MLSHLKRVGLIISCLSVTGCAALPNANPETPSGKGWSVYSQGYHKLMQSSTNDGRGNSSYAMTSAYTNLKAYEKLTPDKVNRKLMTGTNVAEYKFNEDL